MVKIFRDEDAERILSHLFNGDNEYLKKILKDNDETDDNVKKDKKMTTRKINIDDGGSDVSDNKNYAHQPEWGVVTKNLPDGKISTTIIVVAPFAVPKSICAKFDIGEDKLYTVSIDFENNVIPVVSGNITTNKHEYLHITNFKRIDKKSVKISYNINGCFEISFCQLSSEQSGFSFGLSK